MPASTGKDAVRAVQAVPASHLPSSHSGAVLPGNHRGLSSATTENAAFLGAACTLVGRRAFPETKLDLQERAAGHQEPST